MSEMMAILEATYESCRSFVCNGHRTRDWVVIVVHRTPTREINNNNTIPLLCHVKVACYLDIVCVGGRRFYIGAKSRRLIYNTLAVAPVSPTLK